MYIEDLLAESSSSPRAFYGEFSLIFIDVHILSDQNRYNLLLFYFYCKNLVYLRLKSKKCVNKKIYYARQISQRFHHNGASNSKWTAFHFFAANRAKPIDIARLTMASFYYSFSW